MPAPAIPAMPQPPMDPAVMLDVAAPLVQAPAMAAQPQPGMEPVSEPMVESVAEPATAGDAELPIWAHPGNALILAIAALAWQFLSYYAREQLPSLEQSGAVLSNFDTFVGSLPLAGSSIGAIVGVLLAAGALGSLFAGHRAGLREPVLQGVVATVSVISIALVALLPMLVA